jgi:hypothetical protein
MSKAKNKYFEKETAEIFKEIIRSAKEKEAKTK